LELVTVTADRQTWFCFGQFCQRNATLVMKLSWHYSIIQEILYGAIVVSHAGM